MLFEFLTTIRVESAIEAAAKFFHQHAVPRSAFTMSSTKSRQQLGVPPRDKARSSRDRASPYSASFYDAITSEYGRSFCLQRPPPPADGNWVHDLAPQSGGGRTSRTESSYSKPSAGSKLIVSNLHYEVAVPDLVVRAHASRNIFT